MLKVGVVTYSNTIDNYGQVLQYLATQEFLRDFGCESFLLRVKKKIPLWKRLSAPLYRFVKKIIKRDNLSLIAQQKGKIIRSWHVVSNRLEKKHPRYFENFRRQYFNIIEDDGSFFRNYKFDAYCVGSDQTWSESPYFYYLEFAPKECVRFSIAPSIGHKPITDAFVNSVRNVLASYSFITVREKSGLELCQKAGRFDAHLVLDPTFLMSSEKYKSYASPLTKKRPYIFLYLLGAEIPIKVEQIFEFAQKNNLDVKYVASRGRDDGFPKIYAPVEEWLSLMANADFVITNSYHGTALSIIHHKRFMVFPVVGVLSSLNERIENIMNLFSLENRIYSNSLDDLFNLIDWNDIDSVILKNRKLMVSLMESLPQK